MQNRKFSSQQVA